ncbi:3-oxoacid CoA-transferase subunit B [Priestia endophytica]|jgi:acetate CoA/acetoacetate CoA-transferase beta subunit|uniref:3-oxoacid CoA-transferase subunit B n=1 Tax=Priestia endophytica TaxID=135735 RepID=UPI000F522BB4|nr:3-oxoacid CoA-transferase subunit B [Priestia endophytica]MED4073431.1 3-oxoacid CoA-transferase subunit B [Priestia endophytica]RPK13028.1 Acetyl-CoA:acetoacetyl-CoA transferase, beta subunit [Priestia endophytica]
MGMGKDVRNKIAKRAAKEVKNGMIVNLGIGIPSLVPNFLTAQNVMFHAENGMLGMGETPYEGHENPHICNAGGLPVTEVKGASYFDSSIAFAIIRRGLLDMTVLGALEVSEKGDLANWIVPGKRVPGMGGAMELAQKAKKVIVVMSHLDQKGRSKIVKNCSLPLTSSGCVDMIITDLAVFHIKEEKLWLTEVMESYSVKDVVKATDATVHLGSSISSF